MSSESAVEANPLSMSPLAGEMLAPEDIERDLYGDLAPVDEESDKESDENSDFAKEFGFVPRSIRYDWINAFYEGQVRKTYDPAYIDGLEISISTDDLAEPLSAAELDERDAEAYITIINTQHGTEYSIQDLTRNDSGRYFLLLAGHCRNKAIGQIIDKDPELEASKTGVKVNVHPDISVTEAIRRQITENSYSPLTPHEDAYAIQTYYRLKLNERKDGDDYPTIAECARDLVKSETKVREALRFCELPETLQTLVKNDELPYSYVVALHPLMHEYRRKFDPDGSREYADEDIEHRLHAHLSIGIRNKWSADRFQQHISETVRSLQSEQLDFGLILEELNQTGEDMRRQEARALGQQALRHLNLVVEYLDAEGAALRDDKSKGIIEQIKTLVTNMHQPETNHTDDPPLF